MTGSAQPVGLDLDILETALLAHEQGLAATYDDLLRHFPGRDEQILAVLGAIGEYDRRIQQERLASSVLPAGATLSPGVRFGDYTIVGILGQGAMGVVYRACQHSLGNREVALKVLPDSLVDRDPRFIERFRREASLAAAIHHSHIAEVYGVSEIAGSLCFAMRLVEGCTLHDALLELAAERAALPTKSAAVAHVRAVVQLTRDLASALAAIHARGLVHRDVKPANVMLEGCGGLADARPVLVDFGLLRPSGPSDLTGSGTLLGTPAYASPESQLGRDVDARADVFSLGAMLHDLLARTAPGARAPASAGLPPVQACNPAVDRRLAAIVGMALQEDPKLRYRDGLAFQQDLDRYLRDEPVQALPTSVFGRWRLWTRRNQVAAVKIAAAASVVLLVLGVAVGWLVLTAGALWSAATAGERLEREGDLRAAAISLRPLYDSAEVVAWIPGLQAGYERAERYWGAAGSFAEVARRLEAGDPASLQLAHDRIHERLFDDASRQDEALALDFLERELQPDRSAEQRRRALETWADYLLLRPGPNARTQRIQPLLVQIVRGEDPLSQDRDAAAYAIAALGGMPSIEMFEILVDRIGRRSEGSIGAAEAGVGRQTMHCAMRVFEMLRIQYHFGGPMPAPAVLARWLRHAWEAVERLDHPGASPDAKIVRLDLTIKAIFQLASYRRSLRSMGPFAEWPGLEPLHLQALERAERAIDGPPDAAADSEPSMDLLDRIPSRLPGMQSEPAVLAGRATTYRYDDRIWKKPMASRGVSARRVPVYGIFRDRARVDFGLPVPWFGGSTAVATHWQDAAFRSPARATDMGFLEFAHPGRSVLRLRTRVRPQASGLTLRLLQELGARWPMPDCGRVTVAIRVPELGFVVERRVSFGATTWEFDIGPEEFVGHDELTVEVAMLRGNTTYRVRYLETVWRR